MFGHWIAGCGIFFGKSESLIHSGRQASSSISMKSGACENAGTIAVRCTAAFGLGFHSVRGGRCVWTIVISPHGFLLLVIVINIETPESQEQEADGGEHEQIEDPNEELEWHGPGLLHLLREELIVAALGQLERLGVVGVRDDEVEQGAERQRDEGQDE